MTAARKVVPTCRSLAPAVATYLDGELEPCQVVEVEAHLADCVHCREQILLERAMKLSLREPSTRAPESLKQRLAARLAEERTDAATPANDGASPGQWAKVVADTTHQAAALALDGILDELVSLHAQPLPPEITQAEDVRRFDPFVGVKVEPPKLQPFGARFDGARMLPLRNQRAAMLQYATADGHRVTLYVYDSNRVRSQSSRHLHERVVRNTPVYFGTVKGFNVAASERRGIGYTLATDLDERSSLELAAAAVP
jgi:anti-sigma factor RsiW